MIADSQDGLLVEQRDVNALTSAIGKLADDAALRLSPGQAARAISEFDYRVQAKRLEDEIHRAIVNSQ